MGKKSSFKKSRRELLNSMQELDGKLFSIDGYNQPVYRFFPKKWQAEALCNGNIWISTLETCRKYEDPLQGDADEASLIYKAGYLAGGSNDAEFVEMASRAGISIGPGCSNITIGSATSINRMSDAYVLCTSKEFNPKELSDTFGKYCVRISNPIDFFRKASITLNKTVKISQGGVGLIRYQDRHYTGLQTPPNPIGFIKPYDKYNTQQEFRCLWIPESSSCLKPFLLPCPEVRELCRLM